MANYWMAVGTLENWKEGFGLETVFEKQEWTEGRVTELKDLTPGGRS